MIREKGCRNIVVTIQDNKILLGLGDQLAPKITEPLVAIRSKQLLQSYDLDTSLLAYVVQNQAHINQIELNKIKQQAIKEKPQRADQLP